MKSNHAIHTIALLSIAVVAGGSLSSSFRHPIGGPVEHVLQPLLGIAIWAFFIWKIWKRPRQWGLGVGIFLLLMVVFQTFLFRRAMADPNVDAQGANWGTFLLRGELPILIAGVSCILLRICHPQSPTPAS